MRILIAADSLGLPRPDRINSYSPDEKTLAVAYENTYSSLLNKELLEVFGVNPYVEVINRSRRFHTIKNVTDEFPDHLYFYEPDVIVMQVGIVDCWFRDELNGKQMVNKDDFKQYVNVILDTLKNRPNCKLVIIGISPTSIKMQKKFPGINREIRLYNQVLKNVVNNIDIFYIDMQKHINPNKPHSYLLPDGHHLSKEGNLMIFNELLKIIKGFIYADLGFSNYNIGDKALAVKMFESSYESYELNIHNICNLVILYFENKESEKLARLINFVNKNKINSPELNEIIKNVSGK